MAEPLKQLSFGGVTYNQNQVIKKWKSNENGATRYNVLVQDSKSGAVIKVNYPQQKVSNNAKVSLFSTEGYREDIHMEVDNLAYGKITGSDKTDYIILGGCNATVVDVSKDNNMDVVEIYDSKTYKTRNNKVYGCHDLASICTENRLVDKKILEGDDLVLDEATTKDLY